MFTGEGLGAVGRDAEADQEALGGGGVGSGCAAAESG